MPPPSPAAVRSAATGDGHADEAQAASGELDATSDGARQAEELRVCS